MFNTQSRAAAFILGLLLMHTAEAASFPHGCEVSGFGYRENYLILNATGEQAFYLIQNRSDFQIELQRQETQDVFLSPKL